MKPLNGLQTVTVGNGNDPQVSILPGRHDQDTFTLAFQNEGFISDNMLTVKYEYWQVNEQQHWKKSKKGAKGAILCTVAYW